MTKATKFGPVHAIPSYVVGVKGESGCMITGNPESIGEQADCYLSTRPAGVVTVSYFEQCGHCRGSGRVAGRVRLSWKPCPVCKGDPEICPETFISEITK